jgi:anti-sigma factor RsiW
MALLSGELTAAEERQVINHLHSCETCREEFRRDRLVFRMLAACPVVTAAPDFDEALALRIAEEDSKTPIPQYHGAETSAVSPEVTPTTKVKPGSSRRTHRKPT